ncbi:MAG: 2,3-diphosphoglycerate-dependent phosphoglycerate mutase [Muribaculaceae bacterium]|nr:2,3-diphosphoglycerate-dependent phosphoglycerate mutase [Muribaculaceae bacterium]
MKKLILLRHGQSQWNLENRFTGWTDVELSDTGLEEARRAGEKMNDAKIFPDICFTSYLRRAIHTQQIALAAMNRDWTPVIKDWRLNERFYGALQGLNKAETAREYGDEQVRIWRRSYDVQPPAITPDDPRYPGFDPRYNQIPRQLLPLTESLRDTIERVEPFYNNMIVKALKNYRTVLITAHGNSLRGLVMNLLGLSPEQIAAYEIPTGVPIVFELDNELQVIRYYNL